MNKAYFRRAICVLFLLSFIGFISCKKEKAKETEEIISPTSGTRTQFTLDSIFLYASQIYLWNDALPSYAKFNPRDKYNKISSPFLAFQNEIFDISQFKINPSLGTPYELLYQTNRPKYSNIQLGEQ